MAVFSLAFCICAFLTPLARAFTWAEWSPLENYTMSDWRRDAYKYEVHAEYPGPGFRMHILKMTSLKWETDLIEERDKKWKHWVTIIVPTELKIFHSAYVRFAGGEKTDRPASNINFGPVTERMIQFSLATGAICAEVRNIPHQPSVFLDDGLGVAEDSYVAKTAIKFVQGISEMTDVVFFPMLRACRRSLDTVEDYAKQINPSLQITKFMVGGRSKRGWISWLLGGIDRRVHAISPEAFGTFNYYDLDMAHFQALGGWTWASLPYWLPGLTTYERHINYTKFWNDIPVDAYQYFGRLSRIPIMTTMAANEEFFLVDSTWYYWPDLHGDKYLRLVPNSGHRFRSDYDSIWENTASYFLLTMAHHKQNAMPHMTWERSFRGERGKIKLSLDREPLEIRGWMSETTNLTIDAASGIHRRDFRGRILETFTPFKTKFNPTTWNEVPVRKVRNSVYKLAYDPPAVGFRAFFIEVVFEGADPTNPDLEKLILTTEAQVVPDIRPFPPCDSLETCLGTLK